MGEYTTKAINHLHECETDLDDARMTALRDLFTLDKNSAMTYTVLEAENLRKYWIQKRLKEMGFPGEQRDLPYQPRMSCPLSGRLIPPPFFQILIQPMRDSVFLKTSSLEDSIYVHITLCLMNHLQFFSQVLFTTTRRVFRIENSP